MCKKLILAIVILFSMYPFQANVYADLKNKHLKAAFIREDNLWIKIGAQERKLTNGEYIRHPKWSADGNWLAYLRGRKSEGNSVYFDELWLYNVKRDRYFSVKSNVSNNFQWSPTKNELSFLVKKDLYVAIVKPSIAIPAKKVAATIENFSWLPDGTGLLISQKKDRKLNSDIILSKLTFNQTNSIVRPFYTIPVGENEMIVSTSQFKWSPNQKWISFLLNPTASISADGNTLCVLSDNGRVFKRFDEMLNYGDWFKWAPTEIYLGYIGGFGREANVNKQLRLGEFPSFNKVLFTPKGYVDRDLTWESDSKLYVSRAKEDKQANLNERPLPSLHAVNIFTKKHKKVTFPAKNEGDFAPHVRRNHLIWIRTDRENANVFVAPINKTKEGQWIKGLTVASWYYERWNWDEVFSLYKGK